MSSIEGKFFGVKSIPLNQINNVKAKDSNRINTYVLKYQSRKKFYAPVYVQMENGMYKAVANSVLVNAAKNLGLDSILCKYGTLKEAVEENKFRQIGCNISHKNFGLGEVIDSDEKTITVLFADGKKRTISLQDDYGFKPLIYINGGHKKKSDIVNITSFPGDSETVIKLGYDRINDDFIVRKTKNKTKIVEITLSYEEFMNTFKDCSKFINGHTIKDGSLIYEKESVRIVFEGISYSIEGVNIIFDIYCNKPNQYRMFLKDFKTNNVVWDSFEFEKLTTKNQRKIKLETIKPNNPFNTEFYLEIIGPQNAINTSPMVYITADFINDTIEVEIEEREELYTIDFRTFLIRSNNYSDCKGHDVECVKAIVYLFDGLKTIEKEIPAFYCNDCNIFYIKESTFESLKKYGRILCPILSLSEYREMKKQSDGIGSTWAKKSILKMYGYSVSEADNLSAKTRRTILEYIIDSKVLSKQEVIDYLLFFIRYHQNSRKAVAKWESDIDYIAGYKTDFTKKKVGIIYR